MSHAPHLGIGIGWRPEIADAVEALPGIDWVEAVAENVCADHLPDSLVRLRARGVTVVPHGVSLGLGGAVRPDAKRLADLAERAEALGSPLITEHIAFVRAGGPLTASPVLEAGHLLPVPRTKDALRVLCENVRIAQDSLPVPLAVENIAALINWPGEEMTEGQFLAELVERTGVRLLIDVANLHTNHVNRGEDPATALDRLPVDAIAYVHVAGGIERDGVWHDTHAHPVTAPVLDVLAQLRARVSPPGVLLERDDNFPPPAELSAELDTIRTTLRGAGPAPTSGRGTRVTEAAGRTEPAHDASKPPAAAITPHPADTTRRVTAGATRTADLGQAGDASADAGPVTTGPRHPQGVPHPDKAARPAPTATADTTDPGEAGGEPATAEGGAAGPLAPAKPDRPAELSRSTESTRSPGPVVRIRPDQGAGSGAVDRKAEEGDMAEPWRPTTTRQGAAPGHASPARSERQALASDPGPATAEGGAPGAAGPLAPAVATRPQEAVGSTDAARERLALAQTALLSSLVAGTPAPEGFDSRRLGVQSRALAVKRAEVVAKVAPELPGILGDGYRAAFLAYAKSRPMRAGYRRDALDFAEHLLISDRPDDPAARRELTQWWRDRAGARPPGRAVRIARAARAVLVGR